MHQVFDHKNFYAKLDQDLKQARFLVIIQSPFMTLRRVEKLKFIFSDCAARGVRVCVFTQRIEKKFLTEEEYASKSNTLKTVINALFSMGVHVSKVPKIHEKLVIIDEQIFWDGSLNPLSYRDTTERMTRWESREKVLSVVAKHNLNKCVICREALPKGDLQTVFGNIICRRRRSLNMSQKEFGILTGLGQAAISRLEKGKFDCRLSVLARVFSVLQMNCRPIFWYMVSSLDRDLDSNLKSRHDFD